MLGSIPGGRFDRSQRGGRCLRGTVVIRQDAMRRTVEIVELAVGNAPPERRADRERERDGERYQEEEDVHANRRRRSAPATTTSDDTDIPIAASAGDTKPSA